MFKVVIMPIAQLDVKDAARWYDSRKEDLKEIY